MSHSFCLIFTKEAQLRHVSARDPILQEELNRYPLPELEHRFFDSLRRGDRKRLIEYCALSPDPASPADPCAIFSVVFSVFGFAAFHYAFCEKNTSDGTLLNLVFLVESANALPFLMSPLSPTYSCTTAQIVRELLLLSGSAERPVNFLTPEAILTLRHFPTLFPSVMKCEKGLCDVFQITELVIERLQETPLFLHTVITDRSYKPDRSLRILKLSAELYVHILASVLLVLMSVSENHSITLEMLPFAVPENHAPLSMDVYISTVVYPSAGARNDCGTLTALADFSSNADTPRNLLLSSAAALACLAGMETSVTMDYRTRTLTLFLTLNPPSTHEIPGFKYRDPYRSVDPILADLLRFFVSAGGEEERKEQQFNTYSLRRDEQHDKDKDQFFPPEFSAQVPE
ncbi:MAG: hypothetical protein ACI4V1_02290 [Eubacteriales bacterium]